MAKREASEIIIANAVRSGFIEEKDILLLKNRMNKGEEIDMTPIEENEVFVTPEQAAKGLSWLRNKLLTKANYKRKNCNWSNRELAAIGFNGEGEPLEYLRLEYLFTFDGFQCESNGFLTRYEPIYTINGVSYYVKNFDEATII